MWVFKVDLPTLSKCQHAYLVVVLLQEGVTLLWPLPADRQAVQLPPNRPLPDMAAPMVFSTPASLPPVDKYISTLKKNCLIWPSFDIVHRARKMGSEKGSQFCETSLLRTLQAEKLILFDIVQNGKRNPMGQDVISAKVGKF